MFVLIATGNARAYTSGAVWTWQSGDPNYSAAVTPRTGVINTAGFVYGDFLGWTAQKTESEGWGDSGISFGWDDGYIAWIGDGNTNADALDGRWVWIFSQGGWWDLGRPFDRVAVFTSQDHGGYLAEGLEYLVFGSNTLWSDTVSPQAPITDIYLDGWRPHNAAEDVNGNGWLSDDIASVFELDAPYRYIKIAAWSDYGNPNELYEPEIDAVAGIPVPEPGTSLLISTGLVILLAAGRALRRPF
jgi:hypothetical protein